MHITHSFVGTTVGRFRYLFFALYEDYNDFGRAFVQEFNVHLERLARDLRDHGAVVQPFLGDVEETRSHVLAKDWTDDEIRQIRLVPSLLVISKDFDDFSPRSDPWLILHFGERRFGGSDGLAELEETLRAIAGSVADSNAEPTDLYEIARAMSREKPELAQVFQAQPGIFGFSIDIVQAGAHFRDWISARRRAVGRRSEE